MIKDPEYLDECKKKNVVLEYVDGDTMVKKVLPMKMKQ